MILAGNGLILLLDVNEAFIIEYASDCNQNGILDECEPDFDQDGVPDECDDDSDNDGIPDECDASPTGVEPQLLPEAVQWLTRRRQRSLLRVCD